MKPTNNSFRANDKVFCVVTENTDLDPKKEYEVQSVVSHGKNQYLAIKGSLGVHAPWRFKHADPAKQKDDEPIMSNTAIAFFVVMIALAFTGLQIGFKPLSATCIAGFLFGFGYWARGYDNKKEEQK